MSLLSIAETAAPFIHSKNASVLRSAFLNKDAERYYLNREPFKAPNTRATSVVDLRAWSPLARKLSQQLHILNGLTVKELAPSQTQASCKEEARGIVYAARSYPTDECSPARPDGTIDWRIMESLFVCNRMLWQEMAPIWRARQPDLIPPSPFTGAFDHLPCPPILADQVDWAGVESEDGWCGQYQYIDFHLWCVRRSLLTS
jgi:hypothetical protein